MQRLLLTLILAVFLSTSFTDRASYIDKHGHQTSPPTRLAQTVGQLPSPTNRYALIIGVEKYDKDSGIMPLTGPDNDAIQISNALEKFAGFPKDNIVLLQSNGPDRYQPSRTNIITELTRLKSRVPKEGLLLIFFSGHGIARQGETYLLPSNARMYGDDISLLRESSISITTLKHLLSSKAIQQVLIFLDSCREDPEVTKGLNDNPLSNTTVRAFNLDDLNKDIKAFAVVYATDVGYRSYINTDIQQGYFSAAVVEALSGKAANDKGVVTLSSLVQYLQKTVPPVVQRERGQDKIQKPWAQIDGYLADDLVIASSSTPVVDASDESQYVIKLNIGRNVDNVAKKLRGRGLRVVVLDDDDGKQANATEYTVMWIGKAIPPPVASKVISIAKQEMPWLKYVFLQYQRPEWDTQMYLNAHNDWARTVGLRPLSDSDFAKLMNPRLTPKELHDFIETFRR